MASGPKSTNTRARRSPSRSRKPATIDLEAKEVKADNSGAKETASGKATTAQRSKTTEKPEAPKPASKPAQGRTASAKRTAAVSSVPKMKQSTKQSTKTEPAKPAATSSPAKEHVPEKTQKPEKPAVPPASPVQSSGKSGGIFGGLASAVFGAVLAIAGLGAVGQMEDAANLPVIGKLYAGGGATPSISIDDSRLVSLEEQINRLVSAQNSAENPAVDLDPLNNRLEELEARLAALPTSAETPVVDVDLISRINSVEASLAAVRQEIAGIETGAASGPQTSNPDFSEEISALSARIDGVIVDSRKLETLEAQVNSLVSSLGKMQASTTQNSEQLAALVSQSTELKDTVASVKASEKVARSVAVNALATALDNDDPLAQPLSSVEALIGVSSESTRLGELASSGIPTLNDLVSTLDAFTNTVQNPSTVPENASLSDRFWANAQSLVTFRSSGPREGDDPLAILSRVRGEVVNSELDKARTEWLKLPTGIQQNGEPWLTRLDSRIEAYQLQNAISSKLAQQAG
ncbi:MAG: hypothetical protein AAF423_03690 [Pseudomonadota bacterium]